MRDWALLELAPWRGVDFAPGDLSRRLAALAARWAVLRVYRIDGGAVTIQDEDRPCEQRLSPAEAAIVETRERLYRDFFQQVVTGHAIDGRCELAVSLADGFFDDRGTPIFAFQKVRGHSSILMPDIDIVAQNCFDAAEWHDPFDFDDKTLDAMFVGSTTGGGIITERDLANLKHPRLRSALAFKDEPRVTFDLPSICQCDTPETEAAIRRLGVSGRHRTWRDQFASRYILSIDGNGATCSRVAIALRSNSVLVKYASPHLLHYFRGLEPWVHYVPVRRDDEVVHLLADADRTENRDRAIAAEGMRFAAKHLTIAAIADYTADLLRGYIALTSRRGG